MEIPLEPETKRKYINKIRMNIVSVSYLKKMKNGAIAYRLFQKIKKKS